MRRFFPVLAVLFVLSSAHAATYYVDFVSGSDANAGGIATPWKHCPGDNDCAAGSPADTVVLAAGDTVLFKGGVVYRGGGIANVWNGSAGNPITYKGDGWGDDRAIVDGSVLMTGAWTQCASAEDCFGNGNYANIWHTTSTATFFVPRYQDGNYLYHGQEPDPVRAVDYQSTVNFYSVSPLSETKAVSRTYIKDPDVFTQTDSSYWDESYVVILAGTNSKVVAAITGFDTGTDTVSFADIGETVLTDDDGNYRYSVMNQPGIIDHAGEFGIKDGQFYLWTTDPAAKPVSVASSDQIGFNAEGCDWLIYEGFDIRSYYSPNSTFGGCAIRMQDSSSPRSIYCIIRDNEVSLCGNDFGGIEGGAIQALKVDYSTITLNYVHDCMQSTGINVAGAYNAITSNTVTAASGQGIMAQGCTYTRVDHNEVSSIRGSHSNGISGYASCSNLLVAHNRVFDCNQPMTFQYITDLYVYCNLIDGDSGGNNLNIWTTFNGTVNLFACNTIVNNDYQVGNNKSVTGLRADGVLVANCFVDGGAVTNFRRNNVFTGYISGQDAGDLQTGEVYEDDLDVLFTGPSTDDYTLLGTSIARNAGYHDLRGQFPTALFPDYNFELDLDWNERPALATDWDIGAYEYQVPVEGGPDPTPTPTPVPTPTPIPGAADRRVHVAPGGTVYVWDE